VLVAANDSGCRARVAVLAHSHTRRLDQGVRTECPIWNRLGVVHVAG
jgi:hypothetical protein